MEFLQIFKLEVRKFQKQIILFSILSKNEISALKYLIMNAFLSVDHFQSSLLGGCNSKSTQNKVMTVNGQLTKVHSQLGK